MRTSLKINSVVRDETCHILAASLGLSDEEVAAIYRSRVASSEPEKSGVSFRNAADGTPEIVIYEAIGFDWWTGEGMTAKRFKDELDALGAVPKIRQRLNTPGGDAFDGLTIYNLLREHPAQVESRVDGVAASAGSIIAMAGDEIVMAAESMMMIHRAQWVGIGNMHDMLKTAEVLEKLDNQIAASYARKTNRKADTFLKMMDAESEVWLTADEAVKERLADRIDTGEKASAFDASRYKARMKNEAEPKEETIVVPAMDRAAVLERLAQLTEDHLAGKS